MPSFATIMSSVSTKHRPRRRATIRPTEDLPAPMKPTRITLFDIGREIVAFSEPAGTVAAPVSPVHRVVGRRAPVGTVSHPAAPALGEIVIHARLGPDTDHEGDGLGGGHEARLVERHADRIARAEPKQRRLLGRIPAGVTWADPVGDSQRL